MSTLVTLGVMSCIALQAQTWEAGIGFNYHNFSRNRVEVVEAIQLYNFAAQQSNGKQLSMLSLQSKNIFAPTIWAKYRLEDGASPIALGGEVVLKGLYLSVFGEYEWMIHDGSFTVFARPRASIGWNSKFPVSPDWKTFVGEQLPGLTTEEVSSAADLFAKLSPSSFGTALNVCITPQIDFEWDPGWEIIRLRGSLGYNWDLMTLLSSRSQNGFAMRIGAVVQFGG